MICYIDDEKYSLSIKHMLDTFNLDNKKNRIISIKNFEEKENYIKIYKKDKHIFSWLYIDRALVKKNFVKIEKNLRNSYKKSLFFLIEDMAYEHRKKWGILTGIRPIKLYRDLSEKYIPEDTEKILQNYYLVDERKINLMKKIYHTQSIFVDKIQNTLGLYINIPFCPSRCNYCSFFSLEISENKKIVDKYINAVEKEIKYIAPKISTRKIKTIYIGGGTPSCLEVGQIDKLINILKRNFNLDEMLEFTFEMGRADTITKGKLKILKKHNIDRISINPQTFHDETLLKIGRHHSVLDFEEKFYLARKMGFDNINADLILGLDGENLEDMIYNVDKAIKMDIDSITIHSLAIKTKSALGKIGEKIRGFDNIHKIEDIIFEKMKDSGYQPYYLYRQKRALDNMANLGFAKKGKYCLYNVGMMDECQSIIGIGAGATSKILTKEKIATRIPNYKDVNLYIKNLEEMIEKNSVKLGEIL